MQLDVETTLLNRKFTPEVRRALERIPEAEIENWLKKEYPEFFVSSVDETATKAIEMFNRRTITNVDIDPLAVLREIRDSD